MEWHFPFHLPGQNVFLAYNTSNRILLPELLSLRYAFASRSFKIQKQYLSKKQKR